MMVDRIFKWALAKPGVPYYPPEGWRLAYSLDYTYTMPGGWVRVVLEKEYSNED